MSTWVNSGLAHAALTGAMLAIGRTTPPVVAPDTTRSRRSAPVRSSPPPAFGERELPEPRWSGRPLPEAAGVGGHGVSGGSTRPVNPTDGFLAGSVTALAAAPLPVWDADGAATSAWSDAATLASAPVTADPPLWDPSPLPEGSSLGLFSSAGYSCAGSSALDGAALDGAAVEGPVREPAVEPAGDSTAVDRSALGSLDSSGLFVALSRLPTTRR